MKTERPEARTAGAGREDAPSSRGTGASAGAPGTATDVGGPAALGKASICLNMIVKNEARVIRRCLASVKDVIDYWVIVDTGSSDGTQDIIRDFMRDVPGELLERPWVDFGHNRSEAIAAAHGKADYLLFIDADEVLERERPFPPLEKDFYFMRTLLNEITYDRIQLVNNRLPWRYIGVVHEYPWCSEAKSDAALEGMRIVSVHEGARSQDPAKYRRDAIALEKALLDEPDNERYVFYLAQSYRNAEEHDLAIRHYRRRVEMGRWFEEVWAAQYQIAEIMARQGRDWSEVLIEYLKAFEHGPHRAEPLFRIGKHYSQDRKFATAKLFLDRAAQIPFPAKDRLPVEDYIYRYSIAVELAVCAYWLGAHGEATRINNELLRRTDLPEDIFDLVIKNRRFSLDVVHVPPAAAEKRAPSGILVVVPFRNAGSAVAECVASLQLQEDPNFRTLLIDDGSIDNSAVAVPSGDPRFRLVRNKQSRGLARAVLAALRQGLADDTIVVALDARSKLADGGSLRRLAEIYESSGCRAMYSQFREPGGGYGRAMPFPDAEAFAAREVQEYRPGLMTWRAEAMAALGADALRQNDGLDALFDRIIAHVGFIRTFFADDVLCVRSGA